MSELFPTTGLWETVKDGNAAARVLFSRHYSHREYKDGRKPKLFVGPGEKMVLLARDGKALFVWRKFIDASGQKGTNCAVFRNEGPILSSLLILEAEVIARTRWPDDRFYTFVNQRKVKGDGCCFKKAGWKKCGRTKGGLIILEKGGAR